MSTVAAISTPNASGGIAVIRISGEDALSIADKVFRGSRSPLQMDGYTCVYGSAFDGGERLDDVILTVFRAPHSYTGEDVAEISCHGGIFVTRRILRAVLKNGAESAPPGEFTKRAFLNGKLDLTQAEAVMDIISAHGDMELKNAQSLREGAAFKKARKCSEMLMKILGDLAAWADYPEEDVPEVEPQTLAAELDDVRAELSSLIDNYDSGRIIREGIATVIVGRPNVGKSTLFNCLSGCERSIVTDIAGTTRDIVEETVRLGDILLRLSDTAGIRETGDIIEGIGVENAQKLMERSELVIAVFDGGCPLMADDLDIINKINNNNSVAVINKSDAEQLIDIAPISEKFDHIVYLSAKQSDGIDRLEREIEDIFSIDSDSLSDVTATNERQKSCIDAALRYIDEARSALTNGELLDAVTVLIDSAEQSLLELTGEKVTENVVDEVFSRFCVGK